MAAKLVLARNILNAEKANVINAMLGFHFQDQESSRISPESMFHFSGAGTEGFQDPSVDVL